jgi:hypothetical protein
MSAGPRREPDEVRLCIGLGSISRMSLGDVGVFGGRSASWPGSGRVDATGERVTSAPERPSMSMQM